MKVTHIFATVLAGATLSGCHQSKPKDSDHPGSRDLVIDVARDDAEMNAAMTRARTEVDTFVEKIRSGEARDFCVKVPIKDGGHVEYFWLRDVAYKDGTFTGKIDNDPEEVHNVKMGDPITVKKEGIADWLYMRDGRMHGNYTLRVLLKKLSPEEARHWKQTLTD